MGLGACLTTTLAEAREAADTARRMVARGTNPLDERRKSKGSGKTFGEVADQLLVSLAPEWKSDKHAAQWKQSLTVDAARLRPLDIYQISTEDVLVPKPRAPHFPPRLARSLPVSEITHRALPAEPRGCLAEQGEGALVSLRRFTHVRLLHKEGEEVDSTTP